MDVYDELGYDPNADIEVFFEGLMDHDHRHVIPSNEFSEQIFEFFGMSEDDFRRAFEVYAPMYNKLWTIPSDVVLVKDMKEIILRDPGEPHDLIKYKIKEFVWRSVVIHGFISTLELNDLIISYEPSKVDIVGIHSKYHQRLYQELGVRSREELFPTRSDYVQYAKRMQDWAKRLPQDAVRYKLPDGQELMLLDLEGGVRFFSDIPNALKDYLRGQIENRKNPVGRLPIHDNLQSQVFSELKGKALIKACNTSSRVNAICNQNNYQLYKDRLKSEFGIDFNADSKGYPDARSLYMQMHTVYAVETDFGPKSVTRGANRTGKIHVPPYYVRDEGPWLPVKEFYVIRYPDVTYPFIIVRNPDGSPLGIYSDVYDPNLQGDVNLAKAKYLSSIVGRRSRSIKIADVEIPLFFIK